MHFESEQFKIKMNTTQSNNELEIIISMISFYIIRYGLLITITLGISGNIFILCVFRQPKRRLNPCSFYIISAAYVNLIWIIVDPLVRILSTYELDVFDRIIILCKIHRFLAYTLSSLSMLLLALATMDRFFASHILIEYRRLSSLRNAHRLVVTTITICCLIFIDMIYCLNVTQTPVKIVCTFLTRRICRLYNETARLITFALVPYSLIVIFGMGIIRNIREVRRRAMSINRANGSIRRIDQRLVQV